MKADQMPGPDDAPNLETIEQLIAAERAAAKRLVLQADWCKFCLGPLDVDTVDTCADCRSKETP